MASFGLAVGRAGGKKKDDSPKVDETAGKMKRTCFWYWGITRFCVTSSS